MRRSGLATIVALALTVLGGPAGAAKAAYTPDTLVSYVGDTQAEDAYSPAISADGRYVAFAGTFNGVSGVYRKDLYTGELALVAGADSQDAALSAPDAGAPSISGDGRYVSFTTTVRLDPIDDQSGDTGDCSSVYVRDMDKQPGETGAYILASALNGSSEGLTYAGSATSGCPGGGSASADRVALSENGQEVAFTVVGQSDLTGPCTVTTPVSCPTPPAQVVVRDLATDTTTLVSQTMSSLGSTPEAVAGGAALTIDGQALERGGRQISGSTAAISADGSTVAWMGIDIAMQAPASNAEDASGEYDEPLWRRIADGPDSPTRRITGGDDPLCGCAGPLDTSFVSGDDDGAGGPGEPVDGSYAAPGGFSGDPLAGGTSLDSVTPQLSADGQEVAILSNKPRTGEVSRGLEEEGTPATANAFVVDMASGLSRTQALTQITQWASDDFKDLASTGPIENVAISPDGTRLAFTTERTDFPLAPPALTTPTLSQVDDTQLYVANLVAGTLSLVSYGYEGEPANGTVAAPSFGGEGQTLAFASSATNLVYGAYNSGNENGEPGNVFVTSEIVTPAIAGTQTIGPLPADQLVSPRTELLATTRSGPHGSVLLYVGVPGAGTLTASARAEVPVSVAASAKSAAGKAKAKRGHTSKRTVVRSRVVASAKTLATHASLIELKLTSARAYQELVASHDGLYATIGLTFTAHGEATLTSSVQATFHDTPAKPHKKASKASVEKAGTSAGRRGNAKRGRGA